MDTNDKKYIEKIIRDRKHSHDYLLKKSQVYSSFIKLEDAAFINGSLNKKNKELIAIGISIIKDCESCLEWHIHEALKNDAKEDEIIEAIGVAIEMGGGPCTVSARFAHKVLEYYMGKNK